MPFTPMHDPGSLVRIQEVEREESKDGQSGRGLFVWLFQSESKKLKRQGSPSAERSKVSEKLPVSEVV